MTKKVKEKVSSDKIINSESIILFVIFLAIAVSFHIALSIVNPAGKEIASFGIVEILFSIVFTFFVTGLLIWTKNITMTNSHLGTGCGLIAAIALGYAFYLRYRGFYSTIFMVVTGLVVLIYLGKNFFKYRKEDNVSDDEEE